MAKVKYTTETIYIATPERWDALRNASSYIAQEMYADLLFVNSGALMLNERIATLVTDTLTNSVTFLYPAVDADTVRDELYSLLRDGSNEVSFNGTFKYSIEAVKTNNEDLIGLEVKFLEK